MLSQAELPNTHFHSAIMLSHDKSVDFSAVPPRVTPPVSY